MFIHDRNHLRALKNHIHLCYSSLCFPHIHPRHISGENSTSPACLRPTVQRSQSLPKAEEKWRDLDAKKSPEIKKQRIRNIWVFPKIGGFPPKWMVKIMENPIKMDDLGVPLFSETSILWIEVDELTSIYVLTSNLT